MIKIIKEGKTTKKKKTKIIYTITCPCCGCIFECTSKDFNFLSRSMFGCDSIDCPSCKMFIDVDRANVKRREKE